jgi:ubiquinone/menaquinone biosynthesis C-methylase UbiE
MEMLKTVADTIPTDQKINILDASCGTGNFEKVLLESRDSSTISLTGVDMSDEMLTSAKEKHANHATLSFLKTDLNTPLPFEDDSFSHVVSINTLYAVASPEVTLREFYRVLKKEGHLLLVTPKAGFENGLILKEHCKSTHKDEYWHNAHATPKREELLITEAIKDDAVIRQMLTVARYNREIMRNTAFHFFDEKKLINAVLQESFSQVQISSIYARQAFFITATKT